MLMPFAMPLRYFIRRHATPFADAGSAAPPQLLITPPPCWLLMHAYATMPPFSYSPPYDAAAIAMPMFRRHAMMPLLMLRHFAL